MWYETHTPDDAPVDAYSLAVGVRAVEVDDARFLINCKPFYFRGFGKRENGGVRGKGHDDVFMAHGFALLGWLGANSFRTSHYPYVEETLDYAEIWSIANEPQSDTPESRAYFEPLAAEARRLDPSRLVGAVNVMLAPADEEVISNILDVLMLNRYYGWYVNTGVCSRPSALAAELNASIDKHGKPITMTEYGADTLSGLNGATPVPWCEEYQTEWLEMSHRS